MPAAAVAHPPARSCLRHSDFVAGLWGAIYCPGSKRSNCCLAEGLRSAVQPLPNRRSSSGVRLVAAKVVPSPAVPPAAGAPCSSTWGRQGSGRLPGSDGIASADTQGNCCTRFAFSAYQLGLRAGEAQCLRPSTPWRRWAAGDKLHAFQTLLHSLDRIFGSSVFIDNCQDPCRASPGKPHSPAHSLCCCGSRRHCVLIEGAVSTWQVCATQRSSPLCAACPSP